VAIKSDFCFHDSNYRWSFRHIFSPTWMKVHKLRHRLANGQFGRAPERFDWTGRQNDRHIPSLLSIYLHRADSTPIFYIFLRFNVPNPPALYSEFCEMIAQLICTEISHVRLIMRSCVRRQVYLLHFLVGFGSLPRQVFLERRIFPGFSCSGKLFFWIFFF